MMIIIINITMGWCCSNAGSSVTRWRQAETWSLDSISPRVNCKTSILHGIHWIYIQMQHIFVMIVSICLIYIDIFIYYSISPRVNCKTSMQWSYSQSRKNPVSASAMLTRKFLQIRKVFATCSLWAEEIPDNLEKCRDAIQNIQIKFSVQMIWKVSGQSKKCPDNLENVSG